MKKLNYLMVAVILLLFAACEKTELVKEQPETKIKEQAISVQHGMLVFDSQETFDATVEKLEIMTLDERKAWEEELGFKSYQRLIHEIIEAEIVLNDKYESLSEVEQKKLLRTSEYERYSQLTLKYMEKGLVRTVVNENGEEHMEFPTIIFPNVLNEDGMVTIGNNIYQYTEGQFKYLKSRDFSKIENLKITKTLVDNDQMLVANIQNKNKITVINSEAISHTVGRKKIVLRELYNYYGPFSDGTRKAYYQVTAVAERKNWLGSWIGDNTSIWLYGDVHVTDNITNPNPTFSISNYQGAIKSIIVFNQYYPAGHQQPSMNTSISTALRAGGSNGIGVRMINHDDNNPIYLP